MLEGVGKSVYTQQEERGYTCFMRISLDHSFTPQGDQPKAIRSLTKGLREGKKHQTLLGVTGSGKTFTIAGVIEKYQKPTLVIAPNKTLAAQLTQEYREFFPNNSVQYFVSYYDYYRPEAYKHITDTYIEKEAMVNKEIDRLRHSTTQALLTRKDVIVVASVSCIYGLGNPEGYKEAHTHLHIGKEMKREDLIALCVKRFFTRTQNVLGAGMFRVVGNRIDIYPTNEEALYRISFDVNSIQTIQHIHPTTGEIEETLKDYFLFPAKHYVSSDEDRVRAIQSIKKELKEQIKHFEKKGDVIAVERLKRRTQADLTLIEEVGFCHGIENYSRHFDGRMPGEPPHTLLSFFPKDKKGNPDFLTVIDESHLTIPQIGGMLAGDRSRKEALVEFGFRLPSATDNRPLSFEEWDERVGERIYVSATPGVYEQNQSKKEGIVTQIIRPTGLLDPEVKVFPVTQSLENEFPGQVPHIITEAERIIKRDERVLITTLTKKSAEHLSDYLQERDIRAEYLHSDVKTIDRVKILTRFRKGEFDCLVGINLLREGLDLPEVALVAILDADKEGFLRSTTSLIQIMGRAARNKLGKVYVYADKETSALKEAMEITQKRRVLQEAYNTKHAITPETISKNIKDITEELESKTKKTYDHLLSIDTQRYKESPYAVLSEKKKEMEDAVANLDFETAAVLRDEIRALSALDIEKKKKKST